MKKQKVIFYILKWISLIFLSFLLAEEVHSENKKIIMFFLIGFIAAILIWEGIRDFKTNTSK
jgi:hypothetical protein